MAGKDLWVRKPDKNDWTRAAQTGGLNRPFAAGHDLFGFVLRLAAGYPIWPVRPSGRSTGRSTPAGTPQFRPQQAAPVKFG